MLNEKNTVKIKVILITVLMIAATHILSRAEENPPPDAKTESRPPVLKKAVLCESIRDSITPINESVVFSSELGRIYCFTNFDPVYEQTYIFHKYYFKDNFISKRRFKLKPPGWAVQSNIGLRETDKGPWRVDITDADGNIIHSIRFSITD